MSTESSTAPTRNKQRIAVILSTYALRMLGQGVSFFLFARALGAENFGLVVAALAIFSPLAPLVDMGAYSIVSRDIALGRLPIQVIGENLTMMLITLPLAILAALLFVHLSNPSFNLLILFMIGLAYLSISRTSQLLAAIQNTMSQSIPVIVVEAVSAILLISLGLIGLFHKYSLMQWSISYVSIGMCVMLLSLVVLKQHIGSIKFNLWPNARRFKEGLTFSFGNTFQYVYTDVDKIILLKFNSASFTGVYGMASRICALALIPIGAVYSLFYPRFMRSGHGLDIPISRLLIRVLMLSFAYSLIVILVFSVLSPFIPKMLGAGYSEVPRLLSILVISVIFQIFQTPFADAITGMGFQIYRTSIQGLACVVAVLCGFILIPANPTMGVLYLNLIIHGSLLFLYIIICLALLRTFRHGKVQRSDSQNALL